MIPATPRLFRRLNVPVPGMKDPLQACLQPKGSEGSAAKFGNESALLSARWHYRRQERCIRIDSRYTINSRIQNDEKRNAPFNGTYSAEPDPGMENTRGFSA